jgi:hypothetical protein
MINRGYILTLPFVLLIVWSMASCDFKGNEDDTTSFSAFHETTPANRMPASQRTPKSVSMVMPSHTYLNTVDWELRQPLDFSTATVTTTANSTADSIQFRYFCNGTESETTATPSNGTVKKVVEIECDNVLTVEMTAIGSDESIEYVFEIDIAFLNSLGS